MSNYSWSSSYPPELKESMQGWKGYQYTGNWWLTAIRIYKENHQH